MAREASRTSNGEWAVTVSNRRPPACKAGALPAELTALDFAEVTVAADAGFAGVGRNRPPQTTPDEVVMSGKAGRTSSGDQGSRLQLTTLAVMLLFTP